MPAYNLFIQAPFALTIINVQNFVIEMANEKALELWGKREDQVINQNFFDVHPELKDEGFVSILKEVYLSGKSYKSKEIPFYLNRNDILTEVYISFVYDPIQESDGTISKIMGWGIDVTDQVLARQKIEESEIRSRLAIDSGNMGVFDWDFTQEIFLSSPRLLEIFGFKGSPNTSHQDLIETFHPEDRPIRNDAVENSYANGSLVYEARVLWNDKSVHWIRVHGKVTYDDVRQPRKMYGLVTDISEEKMANEKLLDTGEMLAVVNEELAATIEELSSSNDELAQSNKLLSRTNADLDNFIYTASHDLKAPVSNLEGLFNTLLSEIELKPEISGLKEMIDASFLRFKKTVFELTEITKLQNQEVLENDLVHLQDMLQDATMAIQDYIQKSKAEILIDFEVPHVRFSMKNLRSIMYNLVFNAIKYSHPGRKPIVRVSSYLHESYVVIKVSDNGLGLSTDNISKIFGMFKRVHDHVEGTGIGLYIVKKIVDNAGGKIEVESELGKGSNFLIYLNQKQ